MSFDEKIVPEFVADHGTKKGEKSKKIKNEWELVRS